MGLTKFQFLKGSIKSRFFAYDVQRQINFNSLKVRLKVDLDAALAGHNTFQFLKGSIKRMISYQTFTQVTAISIP